MKWKDILFVLGLSAVLGACEKKDIEVFTTDDAGIYFQLIKGYYGTTTEIYTDSLDYSFASLPASMKDVILPATVRTMGKVADPVSYTHLDVYKRQIYGTPIERNQK